MEYLEKSKFTILTIISILLISCGGSDTEDIINDIAKCESINGRTYHSKVLFNSSDLPQESIEQHEIFRFSTYEFTSTLLNKDRNGTYECKGGEVIVKFSNGNESKIAFADEMDSFTFATNGYSAQGSSEVVRVRYFLADSEILPAPEKCEHVEGKSYSNAERNVSLEFSFGQNVTITEESTNNDQAIATCDLGEIYIHRDVYDIDPILVKINEVDNSVTAQINDQYIHLPLTGDILDCNQTPGIPVCVVDKDDSKPRIYKSLTAACVNPEEHIIAFYGECDEFEGRPVVEPIEVCIDEHAPVCGAATSTKPCDKIPCPSMRHQTFDNSCLAQAHGAPITALSACGELEGTPVYELNGPCTLELSPVCGKDEVTTDCTEEDCPLHKYKTFSNQCSADLFLAPIVFRGSCGELENTLSNSEPIVIMTSELPEDTKSPIVNNATIEADVLSLELGYSGCGDQYFELHISTDVAESDPVQVETVFKPSINDECLLAISSAHRFDLSPLKYFLQERSGELNGRVTIQGIGTYEY